MSSPAEELPQELWVQVLQHVGYRQRLSTCALVSQMLSRAAAAATHSAELHSSDPDQFKAFLGWTSSHGSFLTSLGLSCCEYSIRELPCPNLLELDLGRMSVQLGAGSQGAGLLHTCTALTKLEIHGYLLDADGDVAGEAPAHAACLKHLTLGTREPEQSAALEGRVLPHLTSLTHLALSLVDNPGSYFLRHISTMAGLEHLHIFGPEATINADTLPGIERLTALQDLHLANSELEAAYLRPMTGLTRLALANVTLQPSQLLQLLARLLGLRELSLQRVLLKVNEQQDPCVNIDPPVDEPIAISCSKEHAIVLDRKAQFSLHGGPADSSRWWLVGC